MIAVESPVLHDVVPHQRRLGLALMCLSRSTVTPPENLHEREEVVGDRFLVGKVCLLWLFACQHSPLSLLLPYLPLGSFDARAPSGDDCTMPKLGFCPISLVLFVGSALLWTLPTRSKKASTSGDEKDDNQDEGNFQVVFVLGGPGSGKGTQCDLLTKRLAGPWVHLSAGDLLRAERNKAQTSELGALIQARISSGQLVPSSVTCKLIQNAMDECYKSQGVQRFLVDGYPRSAENQSVWEEQVHNATVEFVLFLECPEEVMKGRLLERGQTSGRVDDANVDVIRKRFKTFQEETAPIVAAYEEQGKVRCVQADRPIEDVYQTTATLFQGL